MKKVEGNPLRPSGSHRSYSICRVVKGSKLSPHEEFDVHIDHDTSEDFAQKLTQQIPPPNLYYDPLLELWFTHETYTDLILAIAKEHFSQVHFQLEDGKVYVHKA